MGSYPSFLDFPFGQLALDSVGCDQQEGLA
jgi:hypothetical protein